MKNKVVLKQYLFLLLAVVLSWIIGYWMELDNYDLLLLSLAPFGLLYAIRIRSGRSLEKINLAFRIICWLFIGLSLLQIVNVIFFNIFFHYIDYLDFNTDLYINFFRFLLNDVRNFSFGWLFNNFLKALLYLPIATLIYMAIKTNRQLKTA
ncbi:MAG: hypothetical protein WC745_03065 [Patescibacteria group bacterium]|jgi:hypothetical protein